MTTPSRDRFELDRLAEELASRELIHRPSSPSHALPLFTPLSHSNPYLTASTFDVDAFLLSRIQHAPLNDLRSELRDYLGTLKEELVKLINDDYEAFISLSTDLRGEGARLERLKYPLGTLKSQILESKQELQVIQDDIQGELKKRASLREETALLHLLLKLSDSVTRLESLLLITPPDKDATTTTHNLKVPSHLSTTEHEDGDDTRTRGNRAKHLSRVASEYSQLVYHASKARADKCASVDEIQWRIDRIHSTLSSDLDHLFATTLHALVSGHSSASIKASEPDKAKWVVDLAECLQTYDTLGLWRDAEEVLRREVVREFAKKTIYSGALTAPPSPLVPHTPFPAATSHPPPTARTPYTPYTSFSIKKKSFLSPHPHGITQFLDDVDDPLARLYNQVLRFVERDLVHIMEVADRVGLKTGVSTVRRVEEERAGFEIMSNVVWAEFGRAIMDELGGVIFAAGRPEEFREHHETTQAFLRALESLAPSVHAVKTMRAHPISAAFERRWQLPVYFQLRWKEIVTKLEDALAVTRIEVTRKDCASFATLQAFAVWTAIETCWSAEVYIPDLAFRFWRFTLQLLSRYKTWLDSNLPILEPMQKTVVSVATEKLPGSPSTLSRASTPNPPTEAASAESTAVDDALLRQFAAIIVDIRSMNSRVMALWVEVVSMMLHDMADMEDSNYTNPEEALKGVLSRLTELIPPLSTQITTILTRRCCDALLPVRSVPSQFRAMSNKRAPTEPSYFVGSILHPVKAFFAVGTGDGPGSELQDGFLRAYSEEVFESVCQRYIYYLTAMRKTEESLRRLKKGKKSTFSLFGSSNPGKDDEGRDEERIRTQSILDVNAFGKDAESLGVDVLASETFKSLQNMVYANLIDDA